MNHSEIVGVGDPTHHVDRLPLTARAAVKEIDNLILDSTEV
jgi:hypothetical protein